MIFCKNQRRQDWESDDFKLFHDYASLKNRCPEGNDRAANTRQRRSFLSALLKCKCGGQIREVSDEMQSTYSIVRNPEYKYFLYKGTELPKKELQISSSPHRVGEMEFENATVECRMVCDTKQWFYCIPINFRSPSGSIGSASPNQGSDAEEAMDLDNINLYADGHLFGSNSPGESMNELLPDPIPEEPGSVDVTCVLEDTKVAPAKQYCLKNLEPINALATLDAVQQLDAETGPAHVQEGSEALNQYVAENIDADTKNPPNQSGSSDRQIDSSDDRQIDSSDDQLKLRNGTHLSAESNPNHIGSGGLIEHVKEENLTIEDFLFPSRGEDSINWDTNSILKELNLDLNWLLDLDTIDDQKSL